MSLMDMRMVIESVGAAARAGGAIAATKNPPNAAAQAASADARFKLVCLGINSTPGFYSTHTALTSSLISVSPNRP